VKHKGRQTAV